MVPSITAKHLRIAAETVASSSIAFSIGFFMVGPFYSERSGFDFSFFLADSKPYVVVAVAALLARTRGSAAICLVAGVCVLAVGIYTYLDWIRVPYINDVDLLTFPLKWLFALVALLVSGVSFLDRVSNRLDASEFMP